MHSPGRPSFSIAFVLVTAFGRSIAAQSCNPDWTAGAFTEGGIGGTVFAFTTFDDDGPGPHRPALIAGGLFALAGGLPAANVAKWDGREWSGLGAGVNGPVRALTVYDDDGPGPHLPVLIAAGAFTSAGGVPASFMAQWNGTAWSPLGGGLAGATTPTPGVLSLEVFDADASGPLSPVLYAGGDFMSVAGTPAFGLARWNGAAWSVVGQPGSGGLPQGSIVTALTVFDPDGAGPAGPQLTAAGWMMPVGSSVSGIATWNGTSWTFLGGLFNGAVKALDAVDPDGGGGPLPEVLIATGEFVAVGATAATRIAVWNNGAWFPLGSGLDGGLTPSGLALAVVDLDGPGPAPKTLYAGGQFGVAGGLAASHLARWDGASWASLATGLHGGDGFLTSAHVDAILAFDDDGAGPRPLRLFVGGGFTSADQIPITGVAVWDGVAWSKLGSAIDGPASTLIEFDADGPGPAPPALFVGGAFQLPTPAGLAGGAALWNGSSWTTLGSGPGGAVVAAMVHDLDGSPVTPPVLVAAGDFGVKSWDGSAWTAIGSFGGVARCLAVYDEDGPGPQPPLLFAGGFVIQTVVGYVRLPLIKKWTGASWVTPGIGLSSNDGIVNALAVHDEDGAGPLPAALFVAGLFQFAGGGIVANVAKWNGIFWSPAGNGLVGPASGSAVHALTIFDPDGPGTAPPTLYAGGYFTASGTTPLAHVAAWNGTAWVDVGGGVSAVFPPFFHPAVYALGVVDLDGAGPGSPVLVAGGTISSAGGVAANGIAVWNGSAWSALGAGLSGGDVTAVGSFDDDDPGPIPRALYAGGTFGQAGATSSGNLARWAIPAALSLTLAHSPSGDLVISNSSCIPFGHCVSAFSIDPLNGSAPGLGGFAGLHVAPPDLVFQLQLGVPPFVTTLDAAGAAQFVAPDQVIAPLAGITLFGVSMLSSAAPFAVYPWAASPVASVLL